MRQAWARYLHDRFGAVTKGPGDLHRDPVGVRIAASVQSTAEEAMRTLHAETVSLCGSPNVCLAGGVALNCVSNGRQLPERRDHDGQRDTRYFAGRGSSESPLPAPSR